VTEILILSWHSHLLRRVLFINTVSGLKKRRKEETRGKKKKGKPRSETNFGVEPPTPAE
jgi:hypothetical protein